jgi:serine/threonine protein kinase
MSCSKHPLGSGGRQLCPVCLLEQALAPESVADVIIQVPLGHTAETSVYLVRQDTPSAALLRLKVWRRPSPAGFVEAVAELTRLLEDMGDAHIVPPLAACLDDAGRPAVLSPFKQGLPMLHMVHSRALDPAAALMLLEMLARTLDRCHRAGLAHGSLVPANVLIHPDCSAAFLVDFGLARLFGSTPHAEAAACDRAGIAAIAAALRGSPQAVLTAGS